MALEVNKKFVIFAVIFVTCYFIINFILSGVAGSVGFKHRIGDVSKNHTVQVTPAPYTFMIWNLTFVWLVIGFLYLNSTILCSCGSSKTSDEECEDGKSEPPSIFGKCLIIALVINAVAYTSWLFLWDNLLMTASAVALVCIAITNWIGLSAFSRSLWQRFNYFRTKMSKRSVFYLAMVQNGLALYATWTTIASLVNIAVALVYDGDVQDSAASLGALIALTILIAVYLLLELIFWDNYFRYMITPYFVVPWALTGIHVRQIKIPDDIDAAVNVYTLTLLSVAYVITLIRVGIMIFRHIKKPLYNEVPTSYELNK